MNNNLWRIHTENKWEWNQWMRRMSLLSAFRIITWIEHDWTRNCTLTAIERVGGQCYPRTLSSKISLIMLFHSETLSCSPFILECGRNMTEPCLIVLSNPSTRLPPTFWTRPPDRAAQLKGIRSQNWGGQQAIRLLKKRADPSSGKDAHPEMRIVCPYR